MDSNYPPKMSDPILIALGGNLPSQVGPPEKTLVAALTALEERGAVIRATSRLYHTPAFPAGNGPDYVNAAAWLEAPWSPAEILAHLHAVEATMGRARTQRWGQRTLDLDLLAVGDTILPDPQTHEKWRDLPLSEQVGVTPDRLILPHPRLQDRAFVLVPLADVAPDWTHPLLGRSVSELLTALPQQDRDAVRALE